MLLRFVGDVVPNFGYNTYGAAKGYPSLASCVGIFRDYRGNFIGGFDHNLGTSIILHVELVVAMLTFEIAYMIEVGLVYGWNVTPSHDHCQSL